MPNDERPIKDTCKIPVVLGITGPRNLGIEDASVLEKKLDEIFDEIGCILPYTPVILLAPLLDEGGRLAAKAALRHNVSFYVPMLYSSDECKKLLKTDEERQEFEALTLQAERIIDAGAVNDEEYIPDYFKDDYDRLFIKYGFFVARNCHVLIVVWDGAAKDNGSCVSKVVRFKQKGSTDAGEKGDILSIPDEGLVYQIGFSGNEALEGVLPQFKNFPRGATGSGNTERKIPDMLTGIDRFNRDIEKRAVSSSICKAFEQSRDNLFPADKRAALDEAMTVIVDRFAIADCLSSHYRSLKNRLSKSIMGLGALLVLFYMLYDQMESNIMLLFYIAAFIVVVILLFFTKRKELENKHLDYRALAEGLRIQFFWSLAEIGDEVGSHYLRGQRSELGWIRNAMIGCTVECCCTKAVRDNINERQRQVNFYWISDQQKYFAKRWRVYENRLKKRSLLINALFFISFAVIVMTTFLEWVPGLNWIINKDTNAMSFIPAFIFRNNGSGIEITVRDWLITFTGVLAALIAVTGNFIGKEGLQENAKRNGEMYQLYTRAKNCMEQSLEQGNSVNANRIIKELGHETLAENAEWLILFRERSIEMPK